MEASMTWYHLFSPTTEIAYVSLGAAVLLMALGIVSPSSALLARVDWDVLAIYWGYGMLAIVFRESKMPALVASYVSGQGQKRKIRPVVSLCLGGVLIVVYGQPGHRHHVA
jgi:di/tricarboxylate transporter